MIVTALAVFNWYPFNLGPPYSEVNVFPSFEAFMNYLLSLALWGFFSNLFIYILPLAYLFDVYNLKLQGPRKSWLVLLTTPLIYLLLMFIMILPPLLHGLYPTSYIWLLPLMAGVNIIFAVAQLAYFYQLFLTMGAYLLTGHPLREAFKKAKRRLSVGYVLKIAVILIITPMVIGFVKDLLYTLVGDVRFLEIYLRGYHPETLQAINGAIRAGKEIYYPQAPSWLDLLVLVIVGRLIGGTLADQVIELQKI